MAILEAAASTLPPECRSAFMSDLACAATVLGDEHGTFDQLIEGVLRAHAAACVAPMADGEHYGSSELVASEPRACPPSARVILPSRVTRVEGAWSREQLTQMDDAFAVCMARARSEPASAPSAKIPKRPSRGVL
jgi:hypothetical protein